MRAVGVFAHLQPEPFVLDFELGQLVLAHQVQNLPNLAEVHRNRSHILRSKDLRI